MWYLYFIENKINGKLYIGKTNNLKRRLNKHKLNSENKPLNRSIKKYGCDNFIFQEFQYFETEELCYEMEKYWITYLKEQNVLLYNIAEGGNGIFSGTNHYLYGKHHSEESKLKMSKSHTGKKLSKKTKEKLRIANIGRLHSEESKLKISKIKMGTNHSEESKIKIGISSKGRKHSLKTKEFISKCNRGENNPSSILSDDDVFKILKLWFNIDRSLRSKIGFKKEFYEKNIKNIYPIKIITLYEYLRGDKRKYIYETFTF